MDGEFHLNLFFLRFERNEFFLLVFLLNILKIIIILHTDNSDILNCFNQIGVHFRLDLKVGL